MRIRIVTMKDGKVIMDKYAKPGISVEDIVEIAENEVYGGYADYSKVEVNGKVYAEYEE